MNSDAYLADYSIGTSLEGAGLDQLRDAIFNPESPQLRQALHGALESGQREYYGSDAFKAARDDGLAEDEARFRSEAVERMVLCNTVGDRLGGLTELGKPIWTLREVPEWASKTYKPIEVDWDWPSVERLVRARVHATETIGASNSMQFHWPYYDPAVIIPTMPEPDSAIRDRLAKQVQRLEAAEQRTRDSNGRDGYFKRQDTDLLQALTAVLGSQSATMDRIDEEREATRAERQRLVESVSPSWRALFDRLFDLKQVSGTKHDPAVQAVLDLPEYEALKKQSDDVRGVALAEIAEMQTFLERVRDGKASMPPGVNAGIGIGEIGHPVGAGFLAALAELLLKKPVTLDDARMAALVSRAGTWRALCQPALLDSAERTLATGPAPATEAALRNLAERPSHAFFPTPGRGGDFEGDAWWQDTPARIRTMLAGRAPPPPPQRPGLVGRILFGRKGI